MWTSTIRKGRVLDTWPPSPASTAQPNKGTVRTWKSHMLLKTPKPTFVTACECHKYSKPLTLVPVCVLALYLYGYCPAFDSKGSGTTLHGVVEAPFQTALLYSKNSCPLLCRDHRHPRDPGW